MKFSEFELFNISDGSFLVDGGAMFGIVPKTIWSRMVLADNLNRVKLGLNCLLIKSSKGNILVDTGIGNKFGKKIQQNYGIEHHEHLIRSLARVGIKPEEIDFVVNTHLHFDHCGANTIKTPKIIPNFVKAKYIIQKNEWYNATHPDERTKATYLLENFIPIEESGQLILIDGEYEIIPGVKAIPTDGHTNGHQSILIKSGAKTACYLGDLIPTEYHLKIPYISAYDLSPLQQMANKRKFLNQAVKENWLLIFCHNPKEPFGYLTENGSINPLKNPLFP